MEKITEIINNEEVTKFLKNNLSENEGYLIGRSAYVDDVYVDVFYGITLNYENSKPTFFSYKNIWGNKSELRKEDYIRNLPNEKEISIIKKIPEDKEMLKRFEYIFTNPNRLKTSLKNISLAD